MPTNSPSHHPHSPLPSPPLNHHHHQYPKLHQSLGFHKLHLQSRHILPGMACHCSDKHSLLGSMMISWCDRLLVAEDKLMLELAFVIRTGCRQPSLTCQPCWSAGDKFCIGFNPLFHTHDWYLPVWCAGVNCQQLGGKGELSFLCPFLKRASIWLLLLFQLFCRVSTGD